MRSKILAIGTCALVMNACGDQHQVDSPSAGVTPVDPGGGGGTPPPDAGSPPITSGHWTYYGEAQGLSPDIHDVSPDEGGNVYVAGGDALYVKRMEDETFLRFDASNAGLTENCNDFSEIMQEVPSTPFRQCAILSVAGASPGKAIIGFDGFGIEAQHGTAWALAAGGADVVAFDPEMGTLTRTRHVFLASPPHVVCGATGEERVATCPEDDFWWVWGRRLFHRVLRIVVNHDTSSPLYGDAWMGGEHATFAALLNNAAERGLVDRTAGWGPEWEDAKDVWEHLHPAITPDNGWFINGDGWALSLDPRTGTPWGSNGFRTAFVVGYGPNLAWDQWWMGPEPAAGTTPPTPGIDLWPDPPDMWLGEWADDVRSMSHCADGTLWIGSLTHGLARIDTDGTISHVSTPDAAVHGGGVSAVACDPSDGSAWIGLGRGGVMRLRGQGSFEVIDPPSTVEFAVRPVRSIQIDRWSTPRVVYFAFPASKDPTGQVLEGGGVGAYDGP